MIDDVKHYLDWSAIAVTIGAFTEVLPHIAAAISIVWGVIRIYETDTVQNLLGKKTE